MKENIIKAADFVIYWMIILIPFAVSIAPAPANVFMAWMIFFFLVKRILRRQSILPTTAVNLPLLCFFILTCLSALYSNCLRDTLVGGMLRLLQFSFVLLVASAELKDKKHIHRVIFSIGMGLCLASIDGIWQVATGHDFIRGNTPVLNIGLLRATASFSDSNVLGIYLCALAPLFLGLSLYFFKKKARIIPVMVSLLALTGIVLTYSRPTLLAIYVVLFFMGWVKKDKPILALLIIFLLSAPFIAPRTVKNWAKDVQYNPLRFMCNDDRIAVYHNSINMIKAHPIRGLGANTYMKNYKQYKEYPEYRNIVTLDYMYAHNMYLQMAAELGVIGFGVFIWLLYKLFSELKFIYNAVKDNYLKIIALSLAACLIAFLVNGLTESSLYYSRVAIIFWYLCGMALGLKKFVN